MAAQDKSIKVTIVVDQAAADKAKRAILEIKQQVDSLVKSTEQLGNFLGSGMTKVGTRAGAPGTSSITQATHGQGKAAGPAAAITGIAGAVNQNLKVAANDSKATFKNIEDGFKKLVDSQDREARRLEGIWGRVRRMMGQAMGGPGGGLIAAGVTGPPGAGSVASGTAGAPGVSAPPGAAPGGGAKKPAGGQGFIAGVAQQLGLPVGVVGAGAAVGAGVGIAKSAIGASFGNQMSNIEQALEFHYGRGEARGAIGSIMGGNALAIRHGDMARLHAMRALSSDPAMKALLGQDDILELRRQKMHPTGLLDSIAAGKGFAHGKAAIGEFFGGSLSGTQTGGAAPSRFEKFANKALHPYRGDAINAQLERSAASGAGSVVGNENAQQIEQNLARQKEFALQAERTQRLLEAKMREDPMFNERINTVYGRSGSDTALMRGLGMSGRDIVHRGVDLSGATPKDVRFNAPAIIRAKAESQGRDVGEFTAAFGQLAGYGRGFGGRYNSILSPMTGGLHNAAAIQGVGAQFGKFGALLGRGGQSGIQSMIGRGGLDVTAGAQLSQAGLASMQSPQFFGGMAGTGGSGLMESLMTAAFTGSTGGDMRMAALVQGGLGQREREQAGGLDPLNKALNIRAAMKAAPMAPWTTRNMLLSLSEGQLLDIVNNPKNMPAMLLDNGVTYDMVKSYWQAKNASSFARFGRSTEYGTADQRNLVSEYTKAGGLGFLKGKSPQEINKAINVLAAARAGAGGNANDFVGALRLEGVKAGLFGRPGGRGAGDPFAKGSATAAANAAQGSLSSNEARVMGDEGDVYSKNYGVALPAQLAGDKSRAKAQAGFTAGANAGQAIMGVTKALESFVTALKDMVGDTGRAGPKRASP